MIARPTTTVTVLPQAPDTNDAYGDPVTDNTPTAVGVPASILEQRMTVTSPATGRPETIRTLTARLPSTVTLDAGARLYDERTDVTYIVDDVAQPASHLTTNDLRCELHRVD